MHVGLAILTEPQRRRIGSVHNDRGASSVKQRLSEAALSFANDRAVGSVTHGKSRRAKLGSVRQTRRSQSSVCRCRTEPGAPRREVLRGRRATVVVRARGQLRLPTPDQGKARFVAFDRGKPRSVNVDRASGFYILAQMAADRAWQLGRARRPRVPSLLSASAVLFLSYLA